MIEFCVHFYDETLTGKRNLDILTEFARDGKKSKRITNKMARTLLEPFDVWKNRKTTMTSIVQWNNECLQQEGDVFAFT